MATAPVRDPVALPPASFSLTPEEAGVDASVIIVNWNTRELLRHCLESLLNHTKRRSVEIIVIDNASSDGSAELVETSFPSVRLIRNVRNTGFAFACNQGMLAARGHYYLLLNSDTYIDRDALSDLIDFLDRHPDAGVAGCALLYPDGALQPSCGWFPSFRRNLASIFSFGGIFRRIRDRKKFFAAPFLSFEEHASEREVDWVVGACMLVRREAVLAAGLMDHDIFMFAEEWDWCYRIRRAGFTLVYTPATNITHIGSASWTMADSKRVYAILSSQQYFYKKNYGRLRAALLLAATTLDSFVKSVAWGLLYLIRRTSRGDETLCRRRFVWNISSLCWCLSPFSGTMMTERDVRPNAHEARATT
jgi:hypothetical protein